MNQLSYLLSLIISFCGLFVGIALAYIAPEEIRPGEKYFIAIQNLVLTTTILVFVYYITPNLLLTVLISILTFLFLFYRKLSTKAIYLFLGILFFFSSKNQSIFLLESTLIFFYGFPTGTLFAKRLIKKPKLEVVKKLFLSYCLFLLVCLVLYYANSFLQPHLNTL